MLCQQHTLHTLEFHTLHTLDTLHTLQTHHTLKLFTLNEVIFLNINQYNIFNTIVDTFLHVRMFYI